MYHQRENKKNNLTAFLIVVFLIFFIGVITFYRFNKNKDIQKKKDASQKLEYLEKSKKISASELKKKMKQEEILLLDIRSASEFEEEHIENSVSFESFGEEKKIEKFIESVRKDKFIVIVDSGDTVRQGAQLAFILESEKNFKNVYYLYGGFLAWKSFFYPTISGGNPYLVSDQMKVAKISAAELKEILSEEDGRKDSFVIDTREARKFSAGRIPGAINIPFSDLEKRKKEIPLLKDIFVYGENEFEAFRASVKLYDLGFTETKTLLGGITEWKSGGFEMAK